MGQHTKAVESAVRPEGLGPLPQYPDSAQGAVQALRDGTGAELEGATAIPDPQVEGVWLVTHSEGRAVVYLPGYKNPWGDVREYLDFEEEDIP